MSEHTPDELLDFTLRRWRTERYRDSMLPGAPGATTAGVIVDAIDARVANLAAALARLERIARILPPDMDEPDSALAQARAALSKLTPGT